MISSTKIEYNSSDIQTLNNDRDRENYVHEIVIQSPDVQKTIWEILNIWDLNNMVLIHEDKYINGITADFTLIDNDKIRAIIECKAWDIWVTDYVRWIWQIMQYEYFFEQNIWKWRAFDENFNSVLLFPSSVIQRNTFNIWRFKYPERAIIIEINDLNHVVRKISSDELNVLWLAADKNLMTISQYYLRDNRLFELYLLLRYLMYLHISWNDKKINRKALEVEKLRILNTPNNRNRRNAFISLASLWFINSDNMPTIPWMKIWTLSYENFVLMMYKSYIYPYINSILDYFIEWDNNILQDNKSISDGLREKYNTEDILFLTESEWRYMSSRLSILRDDYWCINFKPKSTKRKLIYDIRELNDNAIIKKIKENSAAYKYLANYKLLVH